VEDDTSGVEVGLIFEYSSAILGESHEISDVFVRSDHFDLGDRLFDMDIAPWFREVFRIGYPEIGASSSLELDEFRIRTRIVCSFISRDEDLIGDLGTRDNHVHIMFSPESFFHDIEVKEPEESTSKSIAKSG
jgi:hypothetical protein